VASGSDRNPIIIGGLPIQVPDFDPEETQEWLDSLDAAVDERGRERARYLMLRLIERAREKRVAVPEMRSTDYVNTIPTKSEPFFPGNEEIERKVLNAAFAKFDVRVTDPFADNRRIAARDLEHFVGHIDADDFAAWSDNLRGDKTNFPSAAAKIEHDFTFAQIAGRVAAAIIALDYFSWNCCEIFRLVIDRTTKFPRAFFCSRRITLADDAFLASTFDHLDAKL